jgi:hypothetical protein
MHGGEAMVMIVLFAGFFAMVFGVVYLRTRQNLAMIEKGMNPKQFANRPAPYKNLKWALLLIGAGVGLFLAFLLHMYVLFPRTYSINADGHRYYNHDDGDGAAAAIYFSLIAIGGGLGLFRSYVMERKWWDQHYKEQDAKDAA